MSGVVAGADLCEAYRPLVYGGRLDADTFIMPGAYRGDWPCPGSKELTVRAGDPPGIVLLECTCPCHAGGPAHDLPVSAGRTGVHPSEVLAGG